MDKKTYLSKVAAGIDCTKLTPVQIATEIRAAVFQAEKAGLNITVFEVGNALRNKDRGVSSNSSTDGEWKARQIGVVIGTAARNGATISPAEAAQLLRPDAAALADSAAQSLRSLQEALNAPAGFVGTPSPASPPVPSMPPSVAPAMDASPHFAEVVRKARAAAQQRKMFTAARLYREAEGINPSSSELDEAHRMIWGKGR